MCHFRKFYGVNFDWILHSIHYFGLCCSMQRSLHSQCASSWWISGLWIQNKILIPFAVSHLRFNLNNICTKSKINFKLKLLQLHAHNLFDSGINWVNWTLIWLNFKIQSNLTFIALCNGLCIVNDAPFVSLWPKFTLFWKTIGKFSFRPQRCDSEAWSFSHYFSDFSLFCHYRFSTSDALWNPKLKFRHVRQIL